jgi:hypothetical protein
MREAAAILPTATLDDDATAADLAQALSEH